MLTDLNFLQIGKSWPPDIISERMRLSRYRDNLFLYKSESNKVNKILEQLSRIERVAGNFIDIIIFAVEFNYYKLITKRITDLLYGDPPIIKVSEEFQDVFSEIEKNNSIVDKLKMATKDVIRFGDGIFRVYVNEDRMVKLNIVTPNIWFPIVNPMNIKEYKYHVIAFESEQNDNDKHLDVEIHSKGSYTRIKFLVRDQKIASVLDMQEDIPTGIDDFSIIHIMNEETSDSIYGTDEFEDIISILSEIQVRVGQIARILDSHASPKMSGPSSALEFNHQTGESSMRSDNYIVTDEKEKEPKYLTWDGNIENSLSEIRLLLEQLYIISEMSPAILGAFGNIGVSSSQESLQVRMFSTILKLQRYSSMLTKSIKKIILVMLSLEGITNINEDDISIIWKDNLPQNPKELAEIANIRTGGKATQSQVSAIMNIDDLSEQMAREELESILEDEAIMNPFTQGTADMRPTNNLGDVDQE